MSKPALTKTAKHKAFVTINLEDMQPGEGGRLETWHPVLIAGKYEKRHLFGAYKFAIEPKTLNEMVNTMTEDRERYGEDAAEIPVDYNHAFGVSKDVEANGAAAWIDDLKVEDGRLLAHFVWNEDGAARVQGKKYKRFSAEFSFAWADETGVEYNKARLHAVTLTNRPFLKALGNVGLTEETQACTIYFSETPENINQEQGEQMNLEELTGKVEKLSAENETLKTELEKAKASALTDEDRALFEDLKAKAKDNEAKAARLDAEDKAKALFEEGKIYKSEIEFYTDLALANPEIYEKRVEKLEKVVPLDERQGNSDSTGADAPTGADVSEQFSVAVKAAMDEHKCSRDKAESIVAEKNPELFNAWVSQVSG